MNIRFVSTLTAEDENQFAPVLLRVVTTLLDSMPIAYTLRIETVDGEVHAHTHAPLTPDAMTIEPELVTQPASRRLADA